MGSLLGGILFQRKSWVVLDIDFKFIGFKSSVTALCQMLADSQNIPRLLISHFGWLHFPSFVLELQLIIVSNTVFPHQKGCSLSLAIYFSFKRLIQKVQATPYGSIWLWSSKFMGHPKKIPLWVCTNLKPFLLGVIRGP